MGNAASLQRIDRARLAALIARERARYTKEHRRSQELFRRGQGSLLAGVPMVWMTMWPGGFPLFFDQARGCHVTDVDGRSYIDFCLGDTGSMSGHSPEPVVKAIRDRVESRGGLTVMLPTEDSLVVAEELQSRFGLPFWQLGLSATDANRNVLRICRQVQKRPFVLVFSHCYHGTVDETGLVIGTDGHAVAKPGNPGPAVDPTITSKVVEFNDIGALREALSERDVACVLMEPALTNIGIVLPLPGYLEEVREVCDQTGTLLVIDETHTWSAGPGGCTAAWQLRPDIVTLGKALASGVPIGAYGLSAEIAERILGDSEADLIDGAGVGGTLAGNALASAAARATLTQVLTEDAFGHMIAVADRFTDGVEHVIASHSAPWCVVRLGARAEYRFCPEEPRSGGESHAACDRALDEYLHLYTVNRGILITPFHNMALMCPKTSMEDADHHTVIFQDALSELFGNSGEFISRGGGARDVDRSVKAVNGGTPS